MTNITDLVTTIDYDKITFTNCTDDENNIDIIIPTIILTIPCGLSFSCLISLMVYTLSKPFIKSK